MPLTQEQIDDLEEILNGIDDDPETSLNGHVRDLLEARKDMASLLRTHENISDNEELADMISDAKTKGLTATAALTALLS